ncbi:MAG TPA: hypothetical protein VHN12_10405 [Geobacteraceae bacterium]|nr:hypothetical protein [Geobacteraceae bacterium]
MDPSLSPNYRRYALTLLLAVNIFFIHALGDAVSPTLLGWLSDLWGLRAALLVTPAAIAAAAGFCFVGKKFIAADMARAKGDGKRLEG